LVSQDKVGYTPLHIASGYLNKGVARILLEAGADPELPDTQKRSALDLVLALKSGTPTSPEFFARRAALDDMAAVRRLLCVWVDSVGLVLGMMTRHCFTGAGVVHV
jgi:hypothetical protein